MNFFLILNKAIKFRIDFICFKELQVLHVSPAKIKKRRKRLNSSIESNWFLVSDFDGVKRKMKNVFASDSEEAVQEGET